MVMDVLSVHGQPQRLQEILNQMRIRHGVVTAQLQMLAAVIPPIQLTGAPGWRLEQSDAAVRCAGKTTPTDEFQKTRL